MFFSWDADGDHFSSRFEELFEPLSTELPAKRVGDIKPELKKFQSPWICDRVNEHTAHSSTSDYHSYAILSPLVREAHASTSRWYLRQLVPVAAIKERIQDFRDLWPRSGQLVGVHVRRTDMAYKYGTPESADRVLIKTMQALPNAHFIVVADNSSSIAMLRKEFPGRVSSPDYDYRAHRRRLTSDSDAVRDLYSLAACPIILGTGGSTFSKTAAELNGAELRTVPWH
jgi:hypothetical protein